MTDPKEDPSAEAPETASDAENTQPAPEAPAEAAPEAAKPSIRPTPVPPKKPESQPVPSFEELADSAPSKPPVAPAKPIAPPKPTPVAREPEQPAEPTPAKVAVKPKPASPAASAPTVDPSISIDEDSGVSIAGLVIDAIAAAAAVAFTALIVQEILPFLK